MLPCNSPPPPYVFLIYYNHKFKRILLGFYQVGQHKTEHNCKVEGKHYIALECFYMMETLHFISAHFNMITLNQIQWNHYIEKYWKSSTACNLISLYVQMFCDQGFVNYINM